jgi:L-ascorbate metabolism protein UlaG (beta-lactamase superfamily)
MTTTLTYLGHSAFQIETGGKAILIDPFLTGNPAATTTADKVKADFIVISHGHGDHVGDAVAIAKRTGALVIANFEICEWISKQGVKNVHAQHIGGAAKHPFGTLKLTLAHHGSMLPDGSNGGSPCGILLKLADGTIYHAGDTGLFSDMKLIGEEGIDVAILPIGDNYTMGPEDAVRAVKFLEPKVVVPVHYNTWPVIAQDAGAWSRQVASATSAKPMAIKPGESLQI